ncbi:hypothetical protein [Aliamphritea spongicola]|nr:hypothetical protein [Aliamphritea spongicola]
MVAQNRIGSLQEKIDAVLAEEKIDLRVRFDSKHPEIHALTDNMNQLQQRVEQAVAGVTSSAARLIPMSHELADSYGNATQKPHCRTAVPMKSSMPWIALKPYPLKWPAAPVPL